jgi:hypothetical protein
MYSVTRLQIGKIGLNVSNEYVELAPIAPIQEYIISCVSRISSEPNLSGLKLTEAGQSEIKERNGVENELYELIFP